MLSQKLTDVVDSSVGGLALRAEADTYAHVTPGVRFNQPRRGLGVKPGVSNPRFGVQHEYACQRYAVMRNVRRPYRARGIFSLGTWGWKPQAIIRRPFGAKNGKTPTVFVKCVAVSASRGRQGGGFQAAHSQSKRAAFIFAAPCSVVGSLKLRIAHRWRRSAAIMSPKEGSFFWRYQGARRRARPTSSCAQPWLKYQITTSA